MPDWRASRRRLRVDPDLTVLETAPTTETRLPEVSARIHRRPMPARACRPADRPTPGADLSGLFTREVPRSTRFDRITDLLGNRLLLAISVTGMLAFGVLVGVALGAFAR